MAHYITSAFSQRLSERAREKEREEQGTAISNERPHHQPCVAKGVITVQHNQQTSQQVSKIRNANHESQASTKIVHSGFDIFSCNQCNAFMILLVLETIEVGGRYVS